MKLIIKTLVMLAMCHSHNAHADAALTFKLSGPDMQSRVKKISISRFFTRIDDPADPQRYLIYQTGKFFPLFEVDQAAKTYTRLTPEVNATLHANFPKTEPAGQDKPSAQSKDVATQQDDPAGRTGESEQVFAAKTSLKNTKKQQSVAGIKCRLIEELRDNRPVMHHCMADKSRLGFTEREVRSLARVFGMARERGYEWLGTATGDEKFVSIKSRDLSNGMTLELVSVSNKPLPVGYLRIPKEYQKVDAAVEEE